MKKKLLTVCSLVLATMSLMLCASCAPKLYEVDEKDFSRWIVRFTSDFPCDMENGYAEFTLQELKTLNYEGKDFTITFPYDPKYREEAAKDIKFTLEPKFEFFYLDDNAERIPYKKLPTEKNYYFMKDRLQIIDNGELHNVQRIFYQGEYSLQYVFCTKLTAFGTPIGEIIGVDIKIIVKNKD